MTITIKEIRMKKDINHTKRSPMLLTLLLNLFLSSLLTLFQIFVSSERGTAK
jgi:hypothetical protein